MHDIDVGCYISGDENTRQGSIYKHSKLKSRLTRFPVPKTETYEKQAPLA